ncbi:hypothetical protein GCM10008018_68850 [Paenibacillus marchantiophytorum]|uniref:Activator of Hsp90 ATPase homologue 1/2-like C-terminal domain-containing protein n=1 Tax=Paenibacillus marchantiophytorum TaxID=1619310 RepID=A0ABQ1FID8_9BACL|nr:SRPBCC domain-containing protein [Paenibacillus marchantiophytorum]GGA14147.1 hypothetical protein GCM10008018_68850 [Paenibacillus marchantiophytorum]
MGSDKVVGQTAEAGFQIGVRRTLPLYQEEAWELLISPSGRKFWLGEVADLSFTKGQAYQTVDGCSGEIRVVKPLEQLRLTWQPAAWEHASTLQIRLLPTANPGRTTISFHQEKLDNEERREEMKARWEAVIADLQSIGELGAIQ